MLEWTEEKEDRNVEEGEDDRGGGNNVMRDYKKNATVFAGSNNKANKIDGFKKMTSSLHHNDSANLQQSMGNNT